MLNTDEFKTIYSCDLFEAVSGSVLLTEKQKDKGALESINLSISGNLIKISPAFLDKQKEVYRKCSKYINHKMICDGVLIYHKKDNENYLIIVEMKSGFNDVKKAACQISSSYIKLKTHLTTFQSYNPSDYKEFGLIFCYPPKKADYNDTTNNTMVMDAKRKMLPKVVIDKFEDYLNNRKKDLEISGKTELDAKAMQIDKLPLKSTCLYTTLPILHYAVNAASVTANLDDIIANFNVVGNG